MTITTKRSEHSGKYTPRPPLCPSCAKIMRLTRTAWRFENPPDRYAYECRTCCLSYIDAAWIEAA
jgi:lysyl-tRNA synthetase class I